MGKRKQSKTGYFIAGLMYFIILASICMFFILSQ